MFNHLFQHLNEQQRRDGAVDHPEFEISHGIGTLRLDREARGNLENFVLDKTSAAHRYLTAHGQAGVVYHDRRGRAGSSTLESLPDEELMWLAQQKGWKQTTVGDPGDEGGGYVAPVEEAEGVMNRSALYNALKLLEAKKGIHSDLPAGSDAMVVDGSAVTVRWVSEEDRDAGTFELIGMGFVVQDGSGSTSKVQVTTLAEELRHNLSRVLTEDGDEAGFTLKKKGSEDYWFVQGKGSKALGGVSKDDQGKFDGTKRSAPPGKGYKKGFDTKEAAAAWVAGAKSESGLSEGVALHHYISSVAGIQRKGKVPVMDLSDYSAIEPNQIRATVIALASRVGTELTFSEKVVIKDPAKLVDFIMDQRGGTDLGDEIRQTIDFEAAHDAYLSSMEEPGQEATAAAHDWARKQVRKAQIKVKRAGKGTWEISMVPSWRDISDKMHKEGRFNAKFGEDTELPSFEQLLFETDIAEAQRVTPVLAFPDEETPTKPGAFKVSSRALKLWKKETNAGPGDMMFKQVRDAVAAIPRNQLSLAWGIRDDEHVNKAQDFIAHKPKQAFQKWMINLHRVSPKLGKYLRGVPENASLLYYLFMTVVSGEEMARLIFKRFFETETDHPGALKWAKPAATNEEIQVINPYASGMWVIRFEDYLYKVTKTKWKWRKPILRDGSTKLLYKWTWARKAKGEMFSPIVQLTIDYDRGSDLFDVTIAEYDKDANKVRDKLIRGMYIDDVTDPEKMLGWLKRGV